MSDILRTRPVSVMGAHEGLSRSHDDTDGLFVYTAP